MHEYDKEERRVLDRARGGEDLRELNEQGYADAHAGLLQEDARDEFRAVAAGMLGALDSKALELELVPGLTEKQEFALEALFMASQGEDIVTDEFISGMERSQLLNQALMHLQPVLALGLRPDFPEGRAIYNQLVSKVNELRSDVKSAIMSEIMPKKAPSPDKAEEQDSDDDADSDDSDDSDGQDEKKSTGLTGALKRMFRLGGEQPADSDGSADEPVGDE